MRILKYLSVAVTLITAFSCSNNSEQHKITHNKKQNAKIAYSLVPDSIYRAGSITKALAVANERQKSESRKLFMNGLDLLVNKNTPAASIEFFKEAIYYYPDEKSYAYLFQSYLKNNELALADSINNSLEGRMDYSETGFNRALIAAAKSDASACIGELEAAIRGGFVFKDRITEEKLFDFLKDNQSFQSLILSSFGNDEKLTRILFASFIESYPDIVLPYEMPKDSSKSFSFDKYISYDYSTFIPGMEDTRFSRDVSQEYMYVGKFKTDNGYGFVYKSYQMMADTLNPVTTNIVSYDTLGKIISNETIGCFCSPLESKAFIINKDLSIDVRSFKTVWESDPLEKGYAGNKIISTEETDKSTFIFTKENKIEGVKKIEEVASSGK